MNKRQVVLDTETTGLDPNQGHRIIEIGCIELISRCRTTQQFHTYLQPDRTIDLEATRIHGITMEFLQDKPRFADIAENFLNFIKSAQLIIHNAPFDLGFINNEFQLCGINIKIEQLCSVEDTLLLARQLHPGQRNNLDALCKRYCIDISRRTLHGALLDAEILADVYLAMTRRQSVMFDITQANMVVSKQQHRQIRSQTLPVIKASSDEFTAHTSYLDFLEQVSNYNCLWKKKLKN